MRDTRRWAFGGTLRNGRAATMPLPDDHSEQKKIGLIRSFRSNAMAPSHS